MVSSGQSEVEWGIDPLGCECTVGTKLSLQSILNGSLKDAGKEERQPGEKKGLRKRMPKR
jgi:hypothetical protein